MQNSLKTKLGIIRYYLFCDLKIIELKKSFLMIEMVRHRFQLVKKKTVSEKMIIC